MRITGYTYKSPSFAYHMSKMQAGVAANRLLTPVADAYADGPTITGSTTDSYVGGVELPDGRIFMVPYTSGKIEIYDPDANTLASGPSIQSASSARYRHGCLTDNGLVVMGGVLQLGIGVYDVKKQTFEIIPITNSSVPATAGFDGVCQSRSGLVVLAPRSTRPIGLFDPYTRTYRDGPVVTSGYSGCVAMSDGRVMLLPFDTASTALLFYDPVTNTATPGPTAGAGTSKFMGGVRMQNGDVLLVPYSSGNLYIYRQATGLVYAKVISFESGSTRWSGGALAPDGRVILAPWDSPHIGIYDLRTDEFSYFTGTTFGDGDNEFGGAVALKNGKVMLLPNTYGKIGLLTCGAGALPAEARQSRFFGTF